MAIRVDFNTPIDGGSGRTDLMRVLASSGPVIDDLDTAVIFSSNFPSAQIESFTATASSLIPGSTSSASGSFTLSRKYNTFPILFACYHQTNGVVLQPHFYNQYLAVNDASGNGSVSYNLERQDLFQVDTIDLGGGNFRLDWYVSNFGAGSALTNGIVRLRTVGQGT